MAMRLHRPIACGAGVIDRSQRDRSPASAWSRAPETASPGIPCQDRTHWAAEGRGAFVREAGSTVDHRLQCAEFTEQDAVRESLDTPI